MSIRKIKIPMAIFLSLMATAVSAFPYEDDLTIRKIGAWATGNTTFYLVVDRNIGPTECQNTTIKVDLGQDSDSQNVLMEKSSIRALALTALTTGLRVQLKLKETCLYGNPTIEQLWIYK